MGSGPGDAAGALDPGHHAAQAQALLLIPPDEPLPGAAGSTRQRGRQRGEVGVGRRSERRDKLGHNVGRWIRIHIGEDGRVLGGPGPRLPYEWDRALASPIVEGPRRGRQQVVGSVERGGALPRQELGEEPVVLLDLEGDTGRRRRR